MAWCRQATSHHLNQSWPRSMSSFGHNKWPSCNIEISPLLAWYPIDEIDTIVIIYKGRQWLHGTHNCLSLRWRHNGCDSVSNHQPHKCLLNRLFRRRSKKTSKLRVTGFVLGIHRWPVNSPHKGPVTRKMFPFDDVIMIICVNTFIWAVELWCSHTMGPA